MMKKKSKKSMKMNKSTLQCSIKLTNWALNTTTCSPFLYGA